MADTAKVILYGKCLGTLRWSNRYRIAHFDYRLQHGYSYEQAFNVMRALRLPYSQAHKMIKRMVLNVAIRNQDDHTKNISFLIDETGKWRLSPTYDVSYA